MRIWDTGKATARENMAQDAFLLETLEQSFEAVLHLYDWWGDCATFGHFIQPEKFFDLEAVQEKKLTLEKRPTGGGIIFHSFDLTFSLAIPVGHPLYFPNTLACYAAVNREVIQVICQFLGRPTEPTLLPLQPPPKDEVSQHFCMASPTKYDVILEGKVGGAAQRRKRYGYLHQGSISLIPPSEELICAVLKEGPSVYKDMLQNGQTLLSSQEELVEGRRSLKDLLVKHFSQHL